MKFVRLYRVCKWIVNILITIAVVFTGVFLFFWLRGDGQFEAWYTLASAVAIRILVKVRAFLDSKSSAQLKMFIDKACVKYIKDQGYYWAQMNFRLAARNKDVYLKTIRLKAPNSVGFGGNDTAFGKNGLKIEDLLPYVEQDLLGLNEKEFREYRQTLATKAIPVRDLVIRKDSYLSVTLAGDFYSERLPDGIEYLPLKNWKFVIEYGGTEKATFKFSFSIHPSSPTYVVERAYEGFE